MLVNGFPQSSAPICRSGVIAPVGRVRSIVNRVRIRSQLLQAEWRFILADLDLRCGKLMPVNPDVCAGKGSRLLLSAIALAKIAFHFEIELLRIIAGQIDPCPAQPKTVVDCGLTKIPVESKDIAIFEIDLDEPTQHQLQFRSTLLDVNGHFS